MQSCSISGIRYELGELRDIDECRECRDDPGMLEVLKIRGLSQYSVAASSARELAQKALGASLQSSTMTPSSIDVLLCGTDLTTDSFFSQEAINKILSHCNLTRAYPIGLSLAACTNSMSVLEVGTALIRSGVARRVACVVLGMREPDKARVMDFGLSVFSDGAVAWIMSSDPGDCEILSTGHASDPALGMLGLKEHAREYLLGTANGVRSAVDNALEPLRLSRDDVDRVITNNYARDVQRTFLQHAGLSMSISWLTNLPRFAHVFSADTLINLSDCMAAEQLPRGAKCLLLGTSPTSWGAVLLQRC